MEFLFVCSFIRLFFYSSFHVLISSFIHTFVLLWAAWMHATLQMSFIIFHLLLLIHSFIYLFIYSFVPLIALSSMLWLVCFLPTFPYLSYRSMLFIHSSVCTSTRWPPWFLMHWIWCCFEWWIRQSRNRYGNTSR